MVERFLLVYCTVYHCSCSENPNISGASGVSKVINLSGALVTGPTGEPVDYSSPLFHCLPFGG